MFFRKKERVIPAWWTAVNRKQEVVGHRVADWLGRKAAGVPRRKVNVIIVVSLLLMVGADVGIMVFWREAYHTRPGRMNNVLRRSVEVSVPAHRAPGRFFLDSLGRDTAGRRLLDSLLKVRPGMRDTLRMLEGEGF